MLDLNTTALIDRMLDIEDPDLVVFTGDNIVSTPDPEAAMTMAFGPVIARGYPWAAVFGNHDAEGPWPRARLMEWITAQPHALAVPGPDFGPLCVGNYRLDVAASTADDAPSALTVYMLDSRATGGARRRRCDWVHADQIAWYEAEAAAVAAAAAPRAPPPALAFFHIPLPEYTGGGVAATRVGTAGEGVCAPACNSELAASLLARDVVAVSVGHDHNNDFCGSHAGGAASLAPATAAAAGTTRTAASADRRRRFTSTRRGGRCRRDVQARLHGRRRGRRDRRRRAVALPGHRAAARAVLSCARSGSGGRCAGAETQWRARSRLRPQCITRACGCTRCLASCGRGRRQRQEETQPGPRRSPGRPAVPLPTPAPLLSAVWRFLTEARSATILRLVSLTASRMRSASPPRVSRSPYRCCHLSGCQNSVASLTAASCSADGASGATPRSASESVRRSPPSAAPSQPGSHGTSPW